MPTTDQSAQAILESVFAPFNLGTLGTWAWSEYLTSGMSLDQFVPYIMLLAERRPEWQARFPAWDALQASGHAMSPAEYVNYEAATIGLMRQYGLPAGFYDQPDDFTALLTGQVSIAEVSQRLASYNTLLSAQDPNILTEASRLGLTSGDLAAYFIDPTRALPLLQQKVGAAMTAGAALTTGYGSLTAEEAARYSELGYGAAAQGFGALANLGEVFAPLPGENTPAIDRATQLGAAFDQNAADQTTIVNRQRRRTAEFQQGGGYAGGTTGIGAATT